MLTLTAVLIAVGAVLAALGTAGFYAVASTAPDPHDLAFTRRMATAGRRLIYVGVPMLAAGHVNLGGAMGGVLVMVGFVAAGSYLTMAPLRATRGAAT